MLVVPALLCAVWLTVRSMLLLVIGSGVTQHTVLCGQGLSASASMRDMYYLKCIQRRFTARCLAGMGLVR